MGVSFSQSLLKSKLEVAVTRMNSQSNKKLNNIKVQRKAIAQLLAEKKDESARIRAEALFHEIHLVEAMEILSLMCQLLAARTSLIAAEKYMPDDLIEGAASIIFCAKRLPIPELTDIAKQFAAKFGEEWVKNHVQNQSGHVNARIVDKLSVTPPAFTALMDYLHETATMFNVQWEPTLVEDNKSANPNALGAIAALPEEKDEVPVSEFRWQPGTLSVTVHEARKLYQTSLFGTMDPYCEVTVDKTNVKYRTKVMKNAGQFVTFSGEHFPFAIRESGLRVVVDVYSRNSLLDDFIGRAFIPAEDLMRKGGKNWYRLGRESDGSIAAGEVLVSSQFMALDGSTPVQLQSSAASPLDPAELAQHPQAPPSYIHVNMQPSPLPNGAGSPTPYFVQQQPPPTVFMQGPPPMGGPGPVFFVNGPPPGMMPMQMPMHMPMPMPGMMPAPGQMQGGPIRYEPAHDTPSKGADNDDSEPGAAGPGGADNAYDLPSTPQRAPREAEAKGNSPDNVPAAQGPPSYDDLEARFRALQNGGSR